MSNPQMISEITFGPPQTPSLSDLIGQSVQDSTAVNLANDPTIASAFSTTQPTPTYYSGVIPDISSLIDFSNLAPDISAPQTQNPLGLDFSATPSDTSAPASGTDWTPYILVGAGALVLFLLLKS